VEITWNAESIQVTKTNLHPHPCLLSSGEEGLVFSPLRDRRVVKTVFAGAISLNMALVKGLVNPSDN
jgi:hypothetical protein